MWRLKFGRNSNPNRPLIATDNVKHPSACVCFLASFHLLYFLCASKMSSTLCVAVHSGDTWRIQRSYSPTIYAIWKTRMMTIEIAVKYEILGNWPKWEEIHKNWGFRCHHEHIFHSTYENLCPSTDACSVPLEIVTLCNNL